MNDTEATAPSVESAPKPYPKCRYCDKDLRPHYDTKRKRDGYKFVKCPQNGAHKYTYNCATWKEDEGDDTFYHKLEVVKITSRKFLGRFGIRDRWCSNNCAIAFANVCVNSGIGMVKKGDS